MKQPIVHEADFIDRFLHHIAFRDQLLEDIDKGCSPLNAEGLRREVLLKLAASRGAVLGRDFSSRRLLVGIVLGMWRESRRIRPNSPTNPVGENCLLEKAKALDWLFKGTDIAWKIYAVDDDCPEESYLVAEEVVANTPYREKIRVLRLSAGHPYSSLPLARLTSPSASTKGGALALGATVALADRCDVVGFTDCDNSVHLAQLGLLLAPLLTAERDAVFGDRRLFSSSTFWHPGRATGKNGALVLLHLRRMILIDRLPIADATSPLKLFSSKYLSSTLAEITNFTFHFDYDLSVLALKHQANCDNVPYIFLDSFEETSWTHIGDERIFFEAISAHTKY
ncbi:glycosyltransferase family protein [Xanthomonas graminis]|uniref:hypothetical protein n=1 Tax=Xanthomonas graminis TaxID=3390026 RepID=UPI001F3C31CE|nr:hypothetical protein [Xanthomonas translucens]UKE73364.1 hypothetical protein KFS85_20555 [Xanthomonas translucens pv. phleipratensis]